MDSLHRCRTRSPTELTGERGEPARLDDEVVVDDRDGGALRVGVGKSEIGGGGESGRLRQPHEALARAVESRRAGSALVHPDELRFLAGELAAQGGEHLVLPGRVPERRHDGRDAEVGSDHRHSTSARSSTKNPGLSATAEPAARKLSGSPAVNANGPAASVLHPSSPAGPTPGTRRREEIQGSDEPCRRRGPRGRALDLRPGERRDAQDETAGAPAGNRHDRELGAGPQGPAAVEARAIDGPAFGEERPALVRHPGVFELDARGRESLGCDEGARSRREAARAPPAARRRTPRSAGRGGSACRRPASRS